AERGGLAGARAGLHDEIASVDRGAERRDLHRRRRHEAHVVHGAPRPLAERDRVEGGRNRSVVDFGRGHRDSWAAAGAAEGKKSCRTTENVPVAITQRQTTQKTARPARRPTRAGSTPPAAFCDGSLDGSVWSAVYRRGCPPSTVDPREHDD